MGPDEAEVPHILALSLWVHSEREKLQYVSFCSFIPFSQPMQSMGMGVGKRPGERVESRQLGCIISGGSQRYALMLTHCCVTLGTTLPSLGLDVPVEVKSASMCEALLALSPLFFFLLACFGVTFLLEDQRGGLGGLGLCYRPGKAGAWWYGLCCLPQVLSSAAFHLSKHLQ